MLVAEDGKLVEHGREELNLYTFNANINPVYQIEEAELTTIKIPALNERHAWNRLECLVGKGMEKHFRLDNVEKYE